MPKKRRTKLAIVDGPDDIPDFPDEKTEAIFWGTHRLSNRLLAEMRPMTDEERARLPRHTRAITIRMDEGKLERLQALAESAGCHYQHLLLRFVSERIEEEELVAAAKSKKPTCSYCGTYYKGAYVVGNNRGTFICEVCIAICQDIVDDHAADAAELSWVL